MGPKQTVTFLSDFGLTDEWVAVCKGVILGIFPEATIIDISHEIPPFDIKKGALVLADALPYMPKGVHLAVIDPGVGTGRRAVAVQAVDGSVLVGPDNGLLAHALRRLGGIASCVEITNSRYLRPSERSTFHGRDVFAPAAAHVAAGVAVSDLGEGLDPATLAAPPWPEPVMQDHFLVCEVIDVDRFGTLRLNVHVEGLDEFGVDAKHPLDVAFGHHELRLPISRTFADVAAGRPVVLFDSSELLCLALNQGSASETYDLGVGDRVTLRSG